MLDIIASYNETLYFTSIGTKRKLSENAALLGHKRLGHIFKQQIERLVSGGILYSLDSINFQVCIECIKEKQTNVGRLGANRCSDVLKLIHTDIYGPFPMTSWNGQ